ncbi:MAG: protein-L-isoaspartate(D-aspartate) O-methyltransferase [Terriglobales bacterium]
MLGDTVAANPIPFDPFTPARLEMVESQLRQRGVRDERLLVAMERVPRHEFVQPTRRDQAYEDHPIVIGEGQTISQPYMVATMVEMAALAPADVVLEIGTGSGYQTAVLAELAAEIFSVERFVSLADSAQRLLAHLNYSNIIISVGDGTTGLAPAAPFDAILVAAAAPRVPPALVEQLREGGRLVIPVGSVEEQVVHLLQKRGGAVTERMLSACKFVPLIGKYGFQPMN